MRQTEFFKTHWKHRHSHGGTLRNSRRGRGARPLSGKAPMHVVFKIHREACKSLRAPVTHTLVHQVIRQYARRFFVKIEQVAVHHDHIHLLVRVGRRSLAQSFLKVVAGQISQRVTGTLAAKKTQPFWKHRPFTRIILGYKAYLTAKTYVRMNEKEARGEISYRKNRLRGLKDEELAKIWS